MKEYKGFVAPEIVLTGPKKDWFLGASGTPPFPIVKDDGNWESQIPVVEKQNKGKFETYNCTGFNTLNAIEILMSYKFGGTYNYSDRWLGIIAGTKEPGNDPQVVCEAIRKYGLIPDEMLPFSDDLQTIGEYYSFKDGDKEACYAEGKKWLEKYEFKHAWVCKDSQPFDEKLNNIKVALKSSPLGIAVYAWASDARDVYISMGSPNHWTTEYGTNEYLKVIDTYEPFRKLVEQNITYCKMFSITLKESISPEQAKTFWQIIADLWLKVFALKKQIDALPPIKEKYPEPLMPKLLDKFCLAIQEYEGYYPGSNSYRKHNPGNIKDINGNFVVYSNYATGWAALKNYVERACTGKHKAYKPDFTIKQFFNVYAPSSDNNNPDKYAIFVANKCGVPVTFQIKDLI